MRTVFRSFPDAEHLRQLGAANHAGMSDISAPTWKIDIDNQWRMIATRSRSTPDTPTADGDHDPTTSTSTSSAPHATSSTSTATSRVEGTSFVLWEADRAGRVDAAKCTALGLPPGPKYGDLKTGQSVTTDDGRVITPDEVVEPDQPGRRVAILFHPENTKAIVPLADGATVLVHVAKQGRAPDVFMSTNALEEDARLAHRAGELATGLGVRELVLTHFRTPTFPGIWGEEQEGPFLDALANAARDAFPTGEVMIPNELYPYEVDYPERVTLDDNEEYNRDT